jgi:hypothetical protein
MEKNTLKMQGSSTGVKFPNDTILKISSPEKEKIEEIKNYLLIAYDVEPTSAVMLSDRPSTLTVYFQFVKITAKRPE